MKLESPRITEFRGQLFRTVNKEIGDIPEELVALPPWISSHDGTIGSFIDDPLAQRFVIKPGESTQVSIATTRMHYPPLEKLHRILPRLMNKSTRSCIAQAGAFVLPPLPSEKYAPFSESDLDTLEQGGIVHMPHTLANIGPNPLIFEVGDRVVRYFYTNPHYMIIGDELLAQESHGLLKGQYGEDYRLLQFEDDKHFPQDAGLSTTIALKVHTKRLVPKSRGLLRITSRQELYAATEEATDHTDPYFLDHPFQLRETRLPIYLPRDVVGELSFHTGMEGVEHRSNHHAVQWPSHLIDPGTAWKLRLEISGDQIPDYVYLTLFRMPSLTGIVAPANSYDLSLRS